MFVINGLDEFEVILRARVQVLPGSLGTFYLYIFRGPGRNCPGHQGGKLRQLANIFYVQLSLLFADSRRNPGSCPASGQVSALKLEF
jgi:hypothetical protein